MNTLLILLTVLEMLLQTLSDNTLVSDINMQVSSSVSQPIVYAGTMSMRNECFKIEIMNMAGAYDGKTLAIYQSETDELTLSTPEKDELIQINPLLLLQAAMPLCNITERVSKKGDETIITMTPKDLQNGSALSDILANGIKDIRKVVIKVNHTSYLINTIDIIETNSTSQLSFVNPRYSQERLAYTLTAEDYPDAYINDLR